jgi:PadR family transcriptional regulator, regulatory protein PadR
VVTDRKLSSLLLTFDKNRRTVLLSKPDSSGAYHMTDVLRGTLDLMILRTLALEPMHGWGISQRIQQLSREALQVGQGSLYPALQRLEQRGWIDSEWGTTSENRRAKYYRLTATGGRALGEELASWRHYVRAVELVLEAS